MQDFDILINQLLSFYVQKHSNGQCKNYNGIWGIKSWIWIWNTPKRILVAALLPVWLLKTYPSYRCFSTSPSIDIIHIWASPISVSNLICPHPYPVAIPSRLVVPYKRMRSDRFFIRHEHLLSYVTRKETTGRSNLAKVESISFFNLSIFNEPVLLLITVPFNQHVCVKYDSNMKTL